MPGMSPSEQSKAKRICNSSERGLANGVRQPRKNAHFASFEVFDVFVASRSSPVVANLQLSITDRWVCHYGVTWDGDISHVVAPNGVMQRVSHEVAQSCSRGF